MDREGGPNTTPPLEGETSLQQRRPAFGLQRGSRTVPKGWRAKLRMCDCDFWHSCKHTFVVPIPIALKSLFGIVMELVTKELRKLRVTTLHLIRSSVPMVCKEIGSSALCGHVDQSSESIRR